MPKGVPTRIAELTPEALAWYQSLEDKSGTLAGLIEIAASETWLGVRVAAALERMEPVDRGRAGRKPTVSDDRLRELVSQGFSPAEIAIEVNLCEKQVKNRLKRLK